MDHHRKVIPFVVVVFYLLLRVSLINSIPDDTRSVYLLRDVISNSSNMRWNGPDPCANWTGLTCRNRTGKFSSSTMTVTHISLPGISFSGEIPPCITYFRSLRSLDLSHNNLRGSIPISLYGMNSLRRLDLSGNKIGGSLQEFDSAMVTVKISANRLFGTLPCFSSSVRSLETLDLSNNAISGGIPTCMSSLQVLTVLNLSSNNLLYAISPRLVFSKELLVLDLSSNDLSGPIPIKIAEEGNERSGIVVLDLSKNVFSGEIPREMTELKGLQGLFLSYNRLSGEIPPSIGNLTYLQALDFSHNYLSGQIPGGLTGCFQLWQLKLDHNNLSGTIRPELDALDSLRILDLGWNNISGEIPLPLAGCKSLEIVDLSHNLLSGELNGAIMKWKNLRFLSLAGNRFSGNLPSWIFSFTNLHTINLSENEFSGFIPNGDFNASVDFNSITRDYHYDAIVATIDGGYVVRASINMGGGIRQAEFNYDMMSEVGIDLSMNSFHGEIPDGLIGLQGLEVLSLSQNYLVGPIPNTPPVGNFVRMINLKKLDLSSNLLSGTIPLSTILSMQDLKQLNLSHNCLGVSSEEQQRYPGVFGWNPDERCPRRSGRGANSGFPVAASSGEAGGGGKNGLMLGDGRWEAEDDEGLISPSAFWISAVISFYVSMFVLCCSRPMRTYMFQALKKPHVIA